MRPMASSSLQNMANNYAQWAAGQDAKYAHIAPADKQKVGPPGLRRAVAPACRVCASAAGPAGSVSGALLLHLRAVPATVIWPL